MTSTSETGTSNRFFALHYGDLRTIAVCYARREKADPAMEPESLIGEVWLRLAGADLTRLNGAEHFLTLSALAMRRALIDLARTRQAAKRAMSEAPRSGGEAGLEQTCAIRQALRRLKKSQARVLVLRSVEGYSEAECAAILRVSPKTIQRRWQDGAARLRELLGCGVRKAGRARRPSHIHREAASSPHTRITAGQCEADASVCPRGRLAALLVVPEIYTNRNPSKTASEYGRYPHATEASSYRRYCSGTPSRPISVPLRIRVCRMKRSDRGRADTQFQNPLP